ncbi:MAG TPA: P-loop NTPase fold protein [Candidatus Limnocylindrales bacterium]|nr:P-loop NTPase fold protein [Candidatus Limnocylindrales bacterium]
MAAPRASVLLLFASEDARVADLLSSRLEREEFAIKLQDIAWDEADPAEFRREVSGLEAVGILVGRAGLPSWLVSFVAREMAPFALIWLPNAHDDVSLSWPSEARETASFSLSKAGEDEREVRALAAFLRTVAANAQPETIQTSAADGDVSKVDEFPNRSDSESSFVPDDGETAGAYVATPADAFDLMTPGARRSLAEAERLGRIGPDGRVHMEHLIGGLYRLANGRTRSAVAEAGVSSTQLAEILGVPEQELLPVAEDTVQPVDHLPALSSHAEQAVVEAATIAALSGNLTPIRARHLFYGALQVPDCTPVEALLATPGFDAEDALRDTSIGAEQITVGAATTTAPRPVAGFQSDDATGDDLFGLDDEIDALATVIAASSVEPPLAIGLFGDWGTGKTFFMNMLTERIDQIAAKELEAKRATPRYCQHVVQLRFNAWHYIEQDLWASLAAAIFDGLDRWITANDPDREFDEDPAAIRERLLTKQARTVDELESAERQRDASAEEIEGINASLEKLDRQYEELVDKVPKTEILKSVVRIAADQKEIREEAEKAQAAIRDELEGVAKATDTDAKALTEAISKSTLEGVRTAAAGWFDLRRGWRLWLPLTVAVVIAVALVLAVVNLVDLTPAIRAVAAAVSAGLGLLIVGAGYLAYPATRVFQLVSKAKSEGDRLIENARTTQRTHLEGARRQAEERRAKAELNAASARAELDDLRLKLLETVPSRKMATFIKRRQASEDYRSRLGVVAKARDDFEELTTLLKNQADAAGKPASTNLDGTPLDLFPAIDRIVLYIDDLDRCKEQDVVAVLQAVHLLLAFRLFVVVVAVDPRWLLHSLKVTSRVLAAADDEKDEPEDEFGWEATPLNYLEKIFQIPYALRPMGKTGFEALVTNLVPSVATSTAGSTAVGAGLAIAGRPAGDVAAAPDATNGHDSTATEAPELIAPTGGGLTATTPTSLPAQEPQPDPGGAVPGHAPAVVAQTRLAPAPREVDMDPVALEITADERACMFQLHELIATPRSAKRFVNVYRLFKASCLPSERLALADPTRYRPILLLLAVLTGYPAEATVILRTLLEREPAGRWLGFVVGLKDPLELTMQVTGAASSTGQPEYVPRTVGRDRINAAERWASLQNKLTRIDAAFGPIDAASFRPWARRVARYGFESSRVLVTEETRQESAAAPEDAPAAAAL